MTIDDINEKIIARYSVLGHNFVLLRTKPSMYCWHRELPLKYISTDIYDMTVDGACVQIKQLYDFIKNSPDIDTKIDTDKTKRMLFLMRHAGLVAEQFIDRNCDMKKLKAFHDKFIQTGEIE